MLFASSLWVVQGAIETLIRRLIPIIMCSCYLCIMEELVGLLAPAEILKHFEYEKLEQTGGVIRVHLIEKNDLKHIPKEILHTGKAVLDGYMHPVELQTFPTQGKEVFLVLKRRRWKVKGTTKGYHNSYEFYEEGMKATKKFGAFLKEIGRG